jgi:hypothetical protein
MRTVFSNTQVCHVWAQQTQARGRGPSIFFEGTDIYSYGKHFLMGRIHMVKGKPVALITTRDYSVTTQKHKGYAWRAVNGLMPHFPSPDVTSLSAAMKLLDSRADGSLLSPLKRVKVSDSHSIKWELECIADAFKEANALRKILGKPARKPKAKAIAAVKAHLEKRLKRWAELNTPEMLAKRSAEAVKRAEAKERARAKAAAERAAAEAADRAERLRKFRAGEQFGFIRGLETELLRVRGDIVQTSAGAEVPLRDAIALYRAIKSGRDVLGQTVGSFTVVRIDRTESDTIVKIGCHTIALSEADAVLGMKEAA